MDSLVIGFWEGELYTEASLKSPLYVIDGKVIPPQRKLKGEEESISLFTDPVSFIWRLPYPLLL